jgi:hypothetical protein
MSAKRPFEVISNLSDDNDTTPETSDEELPPTPPSEYRPRRRQYACVICNKYEPVYICFLCHYNKVCAGCVNYEGSPTRTHPHTQEEWINWNVVRCPDCTGRAQPIYSAARFSELGE